MTLGIDASNLDGGALIYLTELLAHANPAAQGFGWVRVWGSRRVLDALPERDWLEKCHEPLLDGSAFHHTFWKLFRLDGAVEDACDLLFLPGGNLSGFHPQVSMCQNGLPFCQERKRYPWWSRNRWRLEVLRLRLGYSFRRAEGLIFLTKTSKKGAEAAMSQQFKAATVIPHGLNSRFLRPARSTNSVPWGGRLLCVGGIDRYKNLLPLAEAVARLRREGYPLTLHLVGRVFEQATFRTLERLARQTDSGLFLHREVSHATIASVYENADAFVAPSGCETFGLVLPEAMGYGLPIAAARRSALPEVLGEAALFFEPDSVESIVTALRRLADDTPLRATLSQRARQRAEEFSWKTCADETLTYLARIAQHHQRRQRTAEPA